MEINNFRHQIALFGNFDDIIPNGEVIKYFLEVFADRGFVPSQFNEISLNLIGGAPGQNGNRLSLNSNDGSWEIRFGRDRADFIFTNVDLGVFAMLDKISFLADFKDIQDKINKKYPRKIKRIGFVNQYLISGMDAQANSKKISNHPDFFNNSSTIEYSSKIVNRTTIAVPIEEVINVSGELRWLKTPVKINSKNSVFDGLLLSIDINTLPEKVDYRFDNEILINVLNEFSSIESIVNDGYLKIIS